MVASGQVAGRETPASYNEFIVNSTSPISTEVIFERERVRGFCRTAVSDGAAASTSIIKCDRIKASKHEKLNRT